ncbi:MAG: hypothetical protein JXB18_14130 [Sedimentisphaerales bacterium]|nr:hypothetical protein [Sedimentisphaerales bacterium]
MKKQQMFQQMFGFVSVFVVWCVISVSISAQVPQKLNYHGYLTDNVTGNPVNGSVTMTFAIYDVVAGGAPLWTETQTVMLTDGTYSVHLGETTPIALNIPKPYWLGIQPGVEPEMTPREELSSAMYSLFSKQLEGITVKNGKVGIGTTDPQDDLDVHGNAHILGMLRVGPNSVHIGPGLDVDSNPGDARDVMYSTNNGNIYFVDPTKPSDDPNSATGLLGVRQIGIGTENPTEKLDVVGNIKATGNMIATGSVTANSITATDKITATAFIGDGSGLTNLPKDTDWREANGNVYRDTGNVEVAGNIKGQQLCIGADCRNSWPVSCNSCLPNCANGQTLKYNGSAAKWECDGEPVPIPTPVPTRTLYRWLNHGSDRAGDWTDYMDSLSSTQPDIAFNDGRCTLGEVLTVQVTGTKPLYGKYRSHNGNIDVKDDHMTTDNRDDLNSEGWNYENTFGYIYTSQVAGTVPLYRKYQNYSYNSKPARDYMSTLNKNQIGPITGDGWIYERILGYIIAPSSESCQ